MPNTKSAEKALRQSYTKREHNLMWKHRIKSVMKQLNTLVQTKSSNVDILNKEASVLAKTLDKAANKDVIHKNKANRIKSRYAKKVAALLATSAGTEKQAKSTASKSKSKS